MFYFYRCYIESNNINIDCFNFKTDKFYLIWLSTFGKPKFYRSEVSAAEYKKICLFDKFTPLNIIFDKDGNFIKLYFLEENK